MGILERVRLGLINPLNKKGGKPKLPQGAKKERKMKKIIEKKIYDTENSTMLHKWWNGCNSTDLCFCREALYKTAKGNLFLHGEGGPRSKYSRSYGNNTLSWGDGITPMTEDEAIDWLENHEGEEAIIAHFGDKITEA